MHPAAFLAHKVGPFPVGVWGAVIAGGLYIGHSRSKTPTTPTSAVSDVVPAVDNAPPVISPIIEVHTPIEAPAPIGQPVDTADPLAGLKTSIAGMFAHAGVPIATATETQDQRLTRIAMEVQGGQRTLSGNDPNSVANALTWIKHNGQTGAAPTSTVTTPAQVPPADYHYAA